MAVGAGGVARAGGKQVPKEPKPERRPEGHSWPGQRGEGRSRADLERKGVGGRRRWGRGAEWVWGAEWVRGAGEGELRAFTSCASESEFTPGAVTAPWGSSRFAGEGRGQEQKFRSGALPRGDESTLDFMCYV